MTRSAVEALSLGTVSSALSHSKRDRARRQRLKEGAASILSWLVTWTLPDDRCAIRILLALGTRPAVAWGLFVLGTGSVFSSELLTPGQYQCVACTAIQAGILMVLLVPSLTVASAAVAMMWRAVLFNVFGIAALTLGLAMRIRASDSQSWSARYRSHTERTTTVERPTSDAMSCLSSSVATVRRED